MITIHDGRKAYVLNPQDEERKQHRTWRKQKGMTTGSDIVANGSIPSINNMLLFEGLKHKLLSII